MNIKKIIKYILIALPALFLAKCGVETVMYNTDLTPEINPNPTHKMMVHGNFPFEDEVKLDMAILFITTNPICDKVNWLAGIRFPQRFMKSFPATVKDGTFESDVYLDSYLSGVCKWQAYNIYAYTQSKKYNMSIGGESYTPPPNTMRKNDEKVLLKEDRFPAEIRIGTIAYESFPTQGEALDVRCAKEKVIYWKGLPKEKSWTMLVCNYFTKQDETSIRGAYELVPNISSSQKEVEINFIDKGWKE